MTCLKLPIGAGDRENIDLHEPATEILAHAAKEFVPLNQPIFETSIPVANGCNPLPLSAGSFKLFDEIKQGDVHCRTNLLKFDQVQPALA